MLEQITMLALGWLSGVLSPVVVDAIRSSREFNAVIAAIKDELREVSRHCVLASYSVAMHLGTVDRQFLKWVQDSLIVNRAAEVNDQMLDSIERKLSLTDDALTSLAATRAAKGVEALALTKFAVPFVDARVSAWHSIPAAVRLELHAVRSDIRLLDDLVDQSRSYFQLSFGKLSDSDYEAVAQNLRGVYEQYAKRCRRAADRMYRLQAVL
jgi:hypothetical protein